MDWKDVVAKISEIAPMVGAAFGAPGVAVGAAISALAQVFGLKSDAKPEEIIKAIQADPEAYLKLVQARQEYELSILRESLKDVQNARQREVEITKATGRRDYMLLTLAIFGISFPVALVVYLMMKGLPEMDKAVAMMIGGFIGIIIGEYKTIFQYFFGSSASSQAKTDLLARAEPIK